MRVDVTFVGKVVDPLVRGLERTFEVVLVAGVAGDGVTLTVTVTT